ncbi:MAG: hypothetical protein RIR18_927 [Pseudomonadota bacterium]|jgi:intracellular septation protein
MKLLFDLFPVVLFFISFKFAEGAPQQAVDILATLGIEAPSETQGPILLATVVVILATIAQIAWTWWQHKKVDKTLWISLVLVVVLGGMTLILRDESFIKWKPTLLYWVMGSGLLGAVLIFKKNPLGSLLAEKLELPAPIWRKLNFLWSGFFLALGFVNLYVANNFSTDSWVNFKLFGVTGLIFLFVLLQGFYLAPHMPSEADDSKNP